MELVPTLLFMTVWMYCVVATGFAILWYQDRSMQPALLLAIGFGLTAFGIVFILLRIFIVNDLLRLVGNFAIAASVVCVAHGTLRLIKTRTNIKIWSLLLCLILPVQYFFISEDNFFHRVIVTGVFIGLIYLFTAFKLIKSSPDNYGIKCLVAAVFGIIGALILLRLLTIGLSEEMSFVEHVEAGNPFILLFVLPSLILANGIFLFLLITTNLVKEKDYLAMHDFHTNLYNRRGFTKAAQSLIARTKSDESSPMSIIALDADLFKQLNDQYGHQVGDNALIVIADAIRSCASEHFICARIGGEEFAILCPETNVEQAAELYHCISQYLAATPIDGAQDDYRVSLSAGVVAHAKVTHLDQLFHDADKCLYQAKEQGRGCFVAFKSHEAINQ